MDVSTKEISTYITNKGINLKNLSRHTGIPYDSLYASLGNPRRSRPLRGDELLKICSFLEISPLSLLTEN